MSGTATIATPLPQGRVPDVQWVHLVPAGTFSGTDGRGPYRVDAAAIVAASKRDADGRMRPMVVDFVHATHHAAGSGMAAPAAGWVVELQARADGVWGRIDWTPGGRKALADKEYRFISPVFAHRKDGVVTVLHAAALVNNPNLDQLPALHAEQQAPPEGAPAPLDRLLRQTRDGTTPDQAAILAACGLEPSDTKQGTD